MELLLNALRGALNPNDAEIEPGTACNEVYLRIEKGRIPEICRLLRRDLGMRFRSAFAADLRERNGSFRLYYIFGGRLSDAFAIVNADVAENDPSFPSIVGEFPSADWHEREVKDMFGVTPVGHPDLRPLAVHEDWPQDHYPLRKDYPFSMRPLRASGEYLFQSVEGKGVYEIPVGPVHAGVIEPGHFRFSAVGETIVNLEIRHFWTHKGTEKLFERRKATQASVLAERVSGDATVAHSLAYCQAVERLADIEIGTRAALLRAIFAELERLYFHLGDMGGITLDVGFGFGAAQASRLKETVMRLNERLTGSRLLRAVNVVGGVAADLNEEKIREIERVTRNLRAETKELFEIVTNTPSVVDRLETTGILTLETARDLGVLGVIARASGIDEDCRRDHPYAAYKGLRFSVPYYKYGDVMARLRVRVDEIEGSCSIISQAVEKLPDEPARAAVGTIPSGRAALGYAESGRGMVLYWVLTGDKGMIERCKITSPSFINWPAIRYAVAGNIVPDFPLINKSFNLSYSGCDR